MTRTIGAVTSTIGAANALVLLACWIIRETTGVDIPPNVQGYLHVIVTYLAGWLVSPKQALERARVELANETRNNNGAE